MNGHTFPSARRMVVAGLALLLAMQWPLPPARAADPGPTSLYVPTTKILAIGSFTAGAKPELWRPIVPTEMRQTAELYLAGKLDQWFVKTDQSGVVFVLNVTDVNAAKALLEPLPLGRAGYMQFQYIPLGPLSPLRTLLAPAAR